MSYHDVLAKYSKTNARTEEYFEGLNTTYTAFYRDNEPYRVVRGSLRRRDADDTVPMTPFPYHPEVIRVGMHVLFKGKVALVSDAFRIFQLNKQQFAADMAILLTDPNPLIRDLTTMRRSYEQK